MKDLMIVFMTLLLCACDPGIVIKPNPASQPASQSKKPTKQSAKTTTLHCSDMMMAGDYTLMRNTLKKCAQP